MQCKCIPAIVILSGHDLLFETDEGTGKTTALFLANMQNFTPFLSFIISVQCKFIPAILSGRNLLVEAEEGTGKSIGLILGTLQNFTREDGKVSL